MAVYLSNLGSILIKTKLTQLGGLTAEEFCAEYWQKKPLLVRNALPDFKCPISPEELGGLSLDEEVESRLVLEKGGKTPWELRHGPFTEDDLLSLPDSHWTLLVQEINKHVPDFALLLEHFNFLPNWRLDDVMVSYAAEYGTVGPHADNYDVFLLQGSGRRRWQLSWQDSGCDELLPDLPLRVLKNFKPEQEWILEQGDMLYVPPGVVHHGVALEDCMTISVGYRAPNITELTAAYCANIISQMDQDDYFRDPDLKPDIQPGLINPFALHQLRDRLRESLFRDDAELDRFLASAITDVRPGHYLPEPKQPLQAAEIRELIESQKEMWRSEYARFSYIEQSQCFILYVAGEEFSLDSALSFAAKLLCQQRCFLPKTLIPHLNTTGFIELLCALYNLGAVYFVED